VVYRTLTAFRYSTGLQSSACRKVGDLEEEQIAGNLLLIGYDGTHGLVRALLVVIPGRH